MECGNHLGRNDALRIKNRSQVHPHHANYAPEELGVLEKGHGRCQKKSF